QSESVRRATFMIAGFSALLSVPMARFVSTAAVLPLGVIAIGAVLISVLYWRRMESARREEEIALADAGAQSYLGFHLQRVNSLLSSDVSRRRLIKAAEEHRDAAQRWSALAGEVDVDWALRSQSDIAAAAQLRQSVQPVGTLESTTHVDDTAAIAHAVVGRLGELRNLGKAGESFPALLDDPFTNIEQGTLPALLEVMVRSSEHQQIILLTESTTVSSWAHVEAMTGAVGIIEPTVVAKAATAAF
ncbi:MAG TPA: hypothetical protein VL068_14160, partial [Microthrixaceae bacterium]|nr:hypothetical protein [Microthrixaceae bacterium]